MSLQRWILDAHRTTRPLGLAMRTRLVIDPVTTSSAILPLTTWVSSYRLPSSWKRSTTVFLKAPSWPTLIGFRSSYGKGATFDQVRTFFTQEEGEISGPPPVDFAGATRTAALEPGEEQIAELDLRRGRYALICFVTERAGGPPHVAMGMIAEAVVR
jgi:hypothetical protein